MSSDSVSESPPKRNTDLWTPTPKPKHRVAKTHGANCAGNIALAINGTANNDMCMLHETETTS